MKFWHRYVARRLFFFFQPLFFLTNFQTWQKLGLNDTFKSLAISQETSADELDELMLKSMCKGLTDMQRQTLTSHCGEWRVCEVSADELDDWAIDKMLKPWNLLHKNPRPKFIFKSPGSDVKLTDQQDVAARRKGPHYAVELWGSFGIVYARHDEGMRQLQDIARLLTGSAKLAMRVGQGLRSALQKVSAPPATGTLAVGLDQLWRLHDGESNLWLQFCDQAHQQIVLPLETLRKEQMLQRQDLERQALALDKELRDRRGLLEKRRHAYMKAAEMADFGYNNLTNAQMDPNFTPKAIAKLSGTAEKYEAELAEADQFYKEEVDAFRKYQPQYEKQMKHLLLEFQHLEEVRLAHLKKRMTSYAKYAASFTNCRMDLARLSLDQTNAIDVGGDIQQFLETSSTGLMPDGAYQFEPPPVGGTSSLGGGSSDYGDDGDDDGHHHHHHHDYDDDASSSSGGSSVVPPISVVSTSSASKEAKKSKRKSLFVRPPSFKSSSSSSLASPRKKEKEKEREKEREREAQLQQQSSSPSVVPVPNRVPPTRPPPIALPPAVGGPPGMRAPPPGGTAERRATAPSRPNRDAGVPIVQQPPGVGAGGGSDISGMRGRASPRAMRGGMRGRGMRGVGVGGPARGTPPRGGMRGRVARGAPARGGAGVIRGAQPRGGPVVVPPRQTSPTPGLAKRPRGAAPPTSRGRAIPSVGRGAPPPVSRGAAAPAVGRGIGRGAGRGAAPAPAPIPAPAVGRGAPAPAPARLPPAAGRGAAPPVARAAAASPPAAAAAPAGPAKMATALYSYDAKEANELSFPVGALIKVLTMDEASGWWLGELNGKTGLYPGNFSQLVDPTDAGSSSATAVYDYVAQGDDELSVTAGDLLTIVAQHEGWVTAMGPDGSQGLLPDGYFVQS
jgi:Variant SH3 domain/SH3 domain